MRDFGIAAVYFLVLTVGMAFIAGGFAVIHPLGQWMWSWLWSGFDLVRAESDMEFAVRRSAYSPQGMAVIGAALGVFWAAWSVGYRWWTDHWPHES